MTPKEIEQYLSSMAARYGKGSKTYASIARSFGK
jgi:hypothetical protein